MLQAAILGERQAGQIDTLMPEPKDDWVLVKIYAAPMCTEYKAFAEGRKATALGHEAAGEVVAVAQPGRVAVGDRVVVMPQYPCGKCHLCLAGDYIHCEETTDFVAFTGGESGHATMAQYMLKPDWLLIPIPDGISYDHASLACCGLGASFGAFQRLGTTVFDTVLVTGLGPVGLGAVINARYRGARVIGVESNNWRAQRAMDLGAAAVIDPGDADALAQILELTGGRGVDHAIDCSGVVAAHRLCIDATRRRGKVAFVGESMADTPLRISPDMIRKGLTLFGSWHYNLADTPKIMQMIAENSTGVGDTGIRTVRQSDSKTVGVNFMYKCAIVGVGGERARGHAEAYQHFNRGQLVAVSTRRQDKLDAFGEQFGIAARYTDYRELFAREQPDLVHVNTPPHVRLEVFEAAEAAGIPAIIVEKPLAIQWEDFLAIRDFARSSNVKIAINHQLQFQPRRMMLQELVHDGKIGEVRFIDASARMNMAYQGTHTLQAIGAFNPAGRATSVFGQVGGVDGLQETPGRHYAPDEVQGAITYDNGVQALLRCGTNAPHVGDGTINTHKRVAVYGTRGFVQWTMWSWEIGIDGKLESGRHEYGEEDILGQAAMTEAMFDWLEDDKAVHPLCMDAALRDFEIMLAIYASGLERRVVTFPAKTHVDLVAMMHEQLGVAYRG